MEDAHDRSERAIRWYHLAGLGYRIPVDAREGGYRRYTGDACVPGKGEILVWTPFAPGDSRV